MKFVLELSKVKNLGPSAFPSLPPWRASGIQISNISRSPEGYRSYFPLKQPETTPEVGLFLPYALSSIITEKRRDRFWLNILWNIQDLHVEFGPLPAAFISFGVVSSLSCQCSSLAR